MPKGLYSKALLLLLVLDVLVVGCAKKVATPPPPAPAAPTVSLQASPTMIQKGESATLKWSSTNATELNLSPGVGRVAAEGSQEVRPETSTTYTITATGPGGSAEDSARITVAEAPPSAPPAPTPSLEELFRTKVL